LIVALAPLWLLAALVVFIGVGSPVLFWQQRVGRGGRAFHLYKFRTLRPAYDQTGRELSEAARLSRGGRFLRRTRLDELPQLLNVLIGDMALIGPRPLLPQDQPVNPGARLTVRPGITGWAQVNGGVLLSPAEKAGLDAWYISHASPLLDLRILLLTLRSLISGDRRPEPVSARRPLVTTRFAGGFRQHPRAEKEEAGAAHF
jgi:lipopolysaccharide/colanic/teichoic acid biosynthesis glycosyltransferase